MSEKPILYQIVKNVSEDVNYDINSHHWLLAVVVFLLGCQIFVSWSLTDIRDSLGALAVSEEKANQDLRQVTEDIAILRKEIAAFKNGGASAK